MGDGSTQELSKIYKRTNGGGGIHAFLKIDQRLINAKSVNIFATVVQSI